MAMAVPMRNSTEKYLDMSELLRRWKPFEKEKVRISALGSSCHSCATGFGTIETAGGVAERSWNG
jgi:hypothetical protein